MSGRARLAVRVVAVAAAVAVMAFVLAVWLLRDPNQATADCVVRSAGATPTTSTPCPEGAR